MIYGVFFFFFVQKRGARQENAPPSLIISFKKRAHRTLNRYKYIIIIAYDFGAGGVLRIDNNNYYGSVCKKYIIIIYNDWFLSKSTMTMWCVVGIVLRLLSAILQSDIIVFHVVSRRLYHGSGSHAWWIGEMRRVYRRRPILAFATSTARQGVYILNDISAYRDRNGYLF